MAPISVKIKHAGKVHDVPLDPDLPPAAFKEAVYQRTGVPPERMKVMLKGGVLKDDTDWRKVAPKEGQTFMVIGAAGELPKPPSTPTVFLEDMDDSELAQALALPVGLVNLGNTCYMNATVQSMRAIPELQAALDASAPPGLPTALRGLYSSMRSTTDAVTPAPFLNALRQQFPQFGELAREGSGAQKSLGGAMYAQQDAEECWTQLTHALKDVPGLPDSANRKFVEQFMTGEITRVLKSDEAPEEQPSITIERVLKIECNITINTNYMHNGILNALDTTLTKTSPSLNREAVYKSTSRLSRLPTYLTVHMVRFAWRQDINKKTKIMRRVKFPLDYDGSDIATDGLREKLLPLSRRLKELEKERAERRKVRKRTKTGQPAPRDGDVEMRDADAGAPAEGGEAPAQPEVELQDEGVYRAKEREELEALVHPDLKADIGCSVHGLYELIAIVTHKGAAADAGHYMAYVKKRAFHPVSYISATSGAGEAGAAAPSTTTVTSPELKQDIDEDDEDWYKFDDNKVSVFPVDKIPTLEGGGEDSSAYVLLYRARPLA
ncbi:uncharacterized protein PHACADRAFT_261216 [Phanerochaete carnosa HHB-10118-sp]|uniref:Ubiquitin carboxyl-terminal hydrolase n=1 Tax=Phanerochaete carnosa (strain HHB-10118-sp) TaxID=650164 RepID=K5W0L5_PHACS|nr:uncharacterized protein PHACADRAFT_261216 [Phanerochaete carnosa HHB-10118-sp]EKM52645.1 hypothetical protein PHACADRAFT_261216 [Phanerochaete carnosa HHB-10118-sp]